MRGKYKIILIVLLLVILCISNSEILPTRTEITEIDIANVIGLDVYGEEYEMTILRTNSQNQTGSNVSQSNTLKEETISVIRESYGDALKAVQTISNKYLNISHANYYLIGEKSIDLDLKHIVDFLARNYQIRLNAQIYVIKDSTSSDFLQKISTENFKLSDKLDNMQKELESQTITKETCIIDALNILLKDKMKGVLPVLILVEDKEDNIEASKNNINYKAPFDYDGLVVIKNAKIVGYLDKEQTEAYNYIMSYIDDFYLYLKDKQIEMYFGVKNLNTDITFDISEDQNINKITFNTKFKSSFEEVKASINVFSKENTDKYERMQEQVIKKKIENIIQISKELDVDFLELEGKLKVQNPYKYRKIKGDVWEKIKNAKIEVKVDSNLKTTFDSIETNADQMGEK